MITKKKLLLFCFFTTYINLYGIDDEGKAAILNGLKQEFKQCLEEKYWTSAEYIQQTSSALSFLYSYAFKQKNVIKPENKKLLEAFMAKCDLLYSQALGETENKEILKEESEALAKVLSKPCSNE